MGRHATPAVAPYPRWPTEADAIHSAAPSLLGRDPRDIERAWIQESCQRFYEHDWPLMLENPIAPKDGTITMPDEPGFGMHIKPSAWNHPKSVHHVSDKTQGCFARGDQKSACP